MEKFFTAAQRILLLGIAIVCLTCTWPQLQAQTLAFPGAEGFGRFTSGARGAANPQVYVVTNLNDSGPGSFRDAVSQPGRFVVFAVGGIIRLESPVVIKPNTTIAGQTAPGDGIVLTNKTVSFSGSSNTIARYLRIRLGATSNSGKDASGVSNGANIILDHMSFTWGMDEVFSINWDGKGTSIDNITIQNSIIGQGLHRENHSAGGLIQTPDGGKVSLIKNLYISNKTRNPKVKGVNEFVNNVVYNYGNYGNPHGHSVSGDGYIMGDSEGISEANIINNYFVGGPLTPPNKTTPFSRGNQNFKLFASGNYFDNDKDGILDGTLVPYNSTGYPGITNFRTEAWDYPAKAPAMTAEEAYQYIIENVGPRYPRLDQVDALLINEVASKGTEGLYVYRETDLPLANGGVGEVFNGPVPLDSDADGMPDAWEDANGLNKNNPSDAVQVSATNSPYLNIEVYINSIMDTPAPDFLRAPSSVVANATSPTEISLSWTDNTEQEEKYLLERSTNGTSFTQIAELPANATAYTDSGLETKTTYYYRLKAVNATEESGYSTAVSVKTLGVPDAPSNPRPANGTIYSQSTNLKLDWAGSENTVTYKVYFGTDAANLTHKGDVSTPGFTIPNIAENTTYYWRVDAVNEIGTTTGPNWSFQTLALAEAELVAHWSFDATSGTVVVDETPYGNNGTITGISSPQWVTGKVGNALDMSNAAGISTAKVSVPSNNQNYFDDHSFTISMWVKINKPYSFAAGQDAYLIHKGTFEATTGKWYGIQIKNEVLTFAIDDGITKTNIDVPVGASTSYNLFNNEWKHIVAVRDKGNNQIKLYINGLLASQKSSASTSGTIGKSDDLQIGNSPENKPFHDIIDEVRLYNYPLSETEIAQLYNVAEPETPKATNPTPAHQASGLDRSEVALSWSSTATSFNLYTGTSADNLTLQVGDLTETSHSLSDLSEGTTYFWRVDAITESGTVPGDVWSFSTSAPAPTGDMVGHWKLNETGTSTTVEDSGPYENHGQLTNIPDPQWVVGKAGNALDFSNGEANGHIRIPNQPHLFFDETSFSISFWMKAATDLAGTNFYLFHKGAFGHNDAGGTGQWFGLEVKSGLIRFAVDDDINKTEATIPDNSPFFTGDWVHVVAVRDTESDKLRIYRNGELAVEQSDGTNTPIGTALPLLIGNNYNLDGPYKGLMDDFRIYDYALGSLDVAALYSGERAEFIVADPSPFNEAAEMEPSEVELGWTGNAQSYKVYLGTSANNLTLQAEGINGTSHTLSGLDHATTYYWRIDPVVGNESGTGEVWSFTTREAVQKASSPSPDNNTTGAEPVGLTLTWTGNAQTYDLYLGTNENAMELIAEDITLESYTIEQLDYSKTYFWRVDASTGTEIQNGDIWKFSTRESISKASSPQPVNEANGMDTRNLLLSWTGDAEAYNIYMGTDPENLELKKTRTKDLSYQVFWALAEGTQYYWRVDAVKGEEVRAGDIWTFTTSGVTGLADLETEKAFKCYPNPFSDKLSIEFRLKKYETVELSLYDNQNRLVHTFIKGSLNEGLHQLPFDLQSSQLKDLNGGLYYVVLQTSEHRFVRKLVNLR